MAAIISAISQASKVFAHNYAAKYAPAEVEGLANVKTLSTFRDSAFKQAYGVALASGPLAGLTARAVVVLDADNKVLHSQLVAEIKDEPDYDAALAVL